MKAIFPVDRDLLKSQPTTGNSAGRRVASRRSEMTTTSPSFSRSTLSAAAASAVPSASFDPSRLVIVSPPLPPRLSQEQLKQCTEALSFFKKKAKNTATIAQEFSRLRGTKSSEKREGA